MAGLFRQHRGESAAAAASVAGDEFTYDMANVISNGSYGTICVGRLKASGDEIVVKVSNDPQDRASLRSEKVIFIELLNFGLYELCFGYEILRKLNGCDGIIRTFGLQERGNVVCIALEKADGSVYHLLKRPENLFGLHYTAMIDLLRDIKNALDAMSEFHVAHRDIKPENILYFTRQSGIVPKYQFKLCDFGVARFVGRMDETYHTIAGTVAFLHPTVVEALVNDGALSDSKKMNAEKCDLWSMGVTLFFAATYRLPFDSTNPKVLHQIFKKRRPGVISHTRSGENIYVLDNYMYPDWFRHAVSHLISRLFDWPSYSDMLEMFEELSSAPPSEERTIFVLRNGVAFSHRDLAETKHFKAAALPIGDVIGIRAGGSYCFISDKGHIHFHLEYAPIVRTLHACDAGCNICAHAIENAGRVYNLRDAFYIMCELPTRKARYIQTPKDPCPESDVMHMLNVTHGELRRVKLLQQHIDAIARALEKHRLSFPARIEKRQARVLGSSSLDFQLKTEQLDGLARLRATVCDLAAVKLETATMKSAIEMELFTQFDRCGRETHSRVVAALFRNTRAHTLKLAEKYNAVMPDIVRQCRKIIDISQCLEQADVEVIHAQTLKEHRARAEKDSSGLHTVLAQIQRRPRLRHRSSGDEE